MRLLEFLASFNQRDARVLLLRIWVFLVEDLVWGRWDVIKRMRGICQSLIPALREYDIFIDLLEVSLRGCFDSATELGERS